MTAHPAGGIDPDDPVEILQALPGQCHAEFLAEYEAPVVQSRRPEQLGGLHDLLRPWRLGAIQFNSLPAWGRVGHPPGSASGLIMQVGPILSAGAGR